MRLALLALLLGTASAVQAESLAVRSTVAWPSSQGHPVVVDFVTDGLSGGLAFELAFDPALTLAEQAPIVSVPNANASCRSPAPGRMKCLIHSSAGSAALATGTVTLACNVPQATGDYPVTILSANVYDQQAMPRSLGIAHGLVAVQPRPTVNVGSVAVAEGNTGVKTARFTVTLAPVSASPVTLRASTRPGTAMPGVDYTAVEGLPLTIPAGASSTTIDVDVLGDALTELNETFTLALHDVQGAAGEGAHAKGTILDDDKAQLRIADASIIEGDAGLTTATFVVSLSRASPIPVSFDFTTVAGSAAAGADFEPTSRSGRLIDAGRTRVVVEVPVIGDANAEPDETFSVVLSNVTGAELTDGSGTGTITNDDSQAVATVPIGSVQGIGAVSPLLGEVVEVRGIVTAIAGNGYFIQSERADDNSLTSEGLFIRAGNAGLRVGDRVRVRGAVSERQSSSKGLVSSETELLEEARFIEARGMSPPAAAIISLSPIAWKAPEALEALEGMRLSTGPLEVVGPSEADRDPRGQLQPTGTAQVVAAGVPRTYDLGGGNPERLVLDEVSLGASARLSLNVGDRLDSTTAVLGVESGHYALRLVPEARPVVTSGIQASPAPAAAQGRASVAFMRIVPRTGTTDVGSAIAAATRVARAICSMAGSPDVVVLDAGGALTYVDALEEIIRSGTPALSGCATGTRYSFEEFAGASGLLLVKTAQAGEPARSAEVVSKEQIGSRATYRDRDGRQGLIFDQAPTWIGLRLRGPSGKQLVLHALLVSLEPTGSRGAPTIRRRAQDAFVERVLRGRLATSPAARIIVLGNPAGIGFADAPGGRDSPRRAPAALAGGLRDAAAGLPPSQRYTAVESGDAVQRDAILVSPAIVDQLHPKVHPVRINADFSEDLADENTLPVRLSDQDPLVLELDLD